LDIYEVMKDILPELEDMVTDEFVEYIDVTDSPMEISEEVLYHFKNDLGGDESSNSL